MSLTCPVSGSKELEIQSRVKTCLASLPEENLTLLRFCKTLYWSTSGTQGFAGLKASRASTGHGTTAGHHLQTSAGCALGLADLCISSSRYCISMQAAQPAAPVLQLSRSGLHAGRWPRQPHLSPDPLPPQSCARLCSSPLAPFCPPVPPGHK